MVGVEMADCNGGDAVEIKRNTGRDRSFAEHFPERMGAVDQKPLVINTERQARRVMTSRECLTHAQRDQVDCAHDGWLNGSRRGLCRLLAERGPEVVAIQPGDELHANLLGADRLAFAVVGATSEAFRIHLVDHGGGAAVCSGSPWGSRLR